MRSFLGILFIIVAAVVTTEGWRVFKDYHDRNQTYQVIIRERRQQFPFESLETRLQATSRVTQRPRLSPAAIDQLLASEQAISNEVESSGREAMLRKLHEGTVEEFVRREGMGVLRMVGSWADFVLANDYQNDDGTWVVRNKTAIPQPDVVPPTWNERDEWNESIGNDSSSFVSLHHSNTLHFVNPNGFGTIKDRQNVAGFQPHQFNALHEEKPWKIMRLELVGLLLADQPRVYETAMLPRMQDVHGVPTRSLNAFEEVALEKLQQGDPLFVGNVPDGVRMVGAIRSAQQCIKCHGGERGALLGAFSYALRRA
jgi:hypothetical protein